ncbi:MAG: hypothetical protein L0287_34330 [Anaerolineae bacterium]|nr:hypothetical protein [Anaerolineae bacterium]
MSNRKISAVTKCLIDAKESIRDPKYWCPEGIGRDGSNIIPATDECEEIIQHCVLRALSGVASGDAANLLNTVAVKNYDVDSAVDVNRIGHQEVMNLYDLAIALSLTMDNENV